MNRESQDSTLRRQRQTNLLNEVELVEKSRVGLVRKQGGGSIAHGSGALKQQMDRILCLEDPLIIAGDRKRLDATFELREAGLVTMLQAPTEAGKRSIRHAAKYQ